MVAKKDTPADEPTQEELDQKSADTVQDQKHLEDDTRTAEEVNADAEPTEETPSEEAPAEEAAPAEEESAVDDEPTDEPVDDQEESMADEAPDKTGEAGATRPKEVKAAEKPLSAAKETNPVGEATRKENNVDPYSAGQHIANPEPDNVSR